MQDDLQYAEKNRSSPTLLPSHPKDYNDNICKTDPHVLVNKATVHVTEWARQLSRYNDWLRAGRVRGSSPGGGRDFRSCPDQLWGPPSLLYNGYRVFPGSKERPGRDADPSPPSSAVVMEG